MKKILKGLGIALGVLVGLVVIAAMAVYVLTENNLYRKYPVKEMSIAVPTDAATLARGEHLVRYVSVCVDCHGEDLGGGLVVDDPAIGRVYAPNITAGVGGLDSQLTDADIARLLQYAVRTDGRSLWVMPAEDYQYLSATDLAAIIAYVRSVPPVDNEPPAITLGPLGRVLYLTGQLPINTADRIDQAAPKPALPVPPEGITREYGNYLGNIAGCTGCHGPGLSGGPILGAPPDWPPAANITTAGAINGWSEADFISAIRTGVDKTGHQINDVMPWQRYANMSDDELKAIWLFISTAPPKEYGNR